MLRYVFGKSLLLQFSEIFIMLQNARKIVEIREQYLYFKRRAGLLKGYFGPMTLDKSS
jgi:hypothetical protein